MEIAESSGSPEIDSQPVYHTRHLTSTAFWEKGYRA